MTTRELPMNLNLVQRSILDRRISLIIYALGVAAYGILMTSIWPSMADDLSTLEQLWENYPEGLKTVFGADIPFTRFDGFLTLEYFTIMWIIIGVAFSASVATGALAGEIDKGTMELLLAQPVSRVSVVLSKMLFHAAGLAFLIAATMIPLKLGALVIDAELSTRGVAALSLLLFFFVMSFGSLGFLFSAWFSDRGRAVFAVVGLLIFAYALDILAKFNDFIGNFHFLSLFRYYDPYPYMHSATIDWSDLAVYAGISLTASALAAFHFRRRDIAV